MTGKIKINIVNEILKGMYNLISNDKDNNIEQVNTNEEERRGEF